MRTLLLAAVLAALAAPLAIAEDDKAIDGSGKDTTKLKEAPAFTLKDTRGKSHSLEQFKGKIVVLEWTEPGCPYIVNHAKAGTMKKIAADYAKKEVVLLGICTSRLTDTEGMAEFMKEHAIEYTVLMDETGAVGRAYGAKTTPHMFIIKDGKIVYEGAIDNDPKGRKEKGARNHVREALDELIAGKKVSTPVTKPYG